MSHYHHDASLFAAARADESSLECIIYLADRMVLDGFFPIADDRFRHPGIEAIEEALEIHPGADRDLVRGYFSYRPKGVI